MAQQTDFSTYPFYKGKDLGLTYNITSSSFRVWSPPADSLIISIYASGIGGDPKDVTPMQKDVDGTWRVVLKGDLKGHFYTFRALINGKWSQEVPDPYARFVGVNGKRAMIVDPKDSDPVNWASDKSPVFKNKTDAILYELHIRDASIHSSSGIKHKGKYLGLTETNTRNSSGLSTGLDHISDLGVTHVHLLPFFDFYSIDETKSNLPQYNWGYEPLNYNTTEGSYATDANDGKVRVKEFKSLVQAFHKKGLRVVMDAVYNHTMLTKDSYMDQLVPGYYYRQNRDGSYSNATACGNEIASERPMVRKFMLESVLYWVNEYHLDGFRFDLMGVHDIETMNLISKELHKIRPDILLYGEGWTAGSSPLPDDQRALKKNVSKLDRIAVFSDDIRDGIKGSVFEHADRGFASGKSGMKESVKFGVVAAIKHPQIGYDKVNYSKESYATEPYQTITYCECHDNHILYDKLMLSAPSKDPKSIENMQRLALSIVLSSQGITFLHAGTEMLRSKKGVENSYNSGDSINAIDWDLKSKNIDMFRYVQGLIKMRKDHPAFRMNSAELIRNNLRFIDNSDPNVIQYTINASAVKDKWKKIMVVYNGSDKKVDVDLSDAKWKGYVVNNAIQKTPSSPVKIISVEAWSCFIAYQE